LSGAAVFTAAGRTGAVPPNEVSVRVHRTRVGTEIGAGGGDEQRPTADGGDQRAGDHHGGSRSLCPCRRRPSCRPVGVRVTTRRCRRRCVNGAFAPPATHPASIAIVVGVPFRTAVCGATDAVGTHRFAQFRRGWVRLLFVIPAG